MFFSQKRIFIAHTTCQHTSTRENTNSDFERDVTHHQGRLGHNDVMDDRGEGARETFSTSLIVTSKNCCNLCCKLKLSNSWIKEIIYFFLVTNIHNSADHKRTIQT